MRFFLAIPALVWLLLSATCFAAGEYLSKTWAYAPSMPMTITIVTVYALGALLWLPALLHHNHLAIMGTAWLLLGMVATVCIGVFAFREHIGLLQGMGIVLAVASLVLLSIPSK